MEGWRKAALVALPGMQASGGWKKVATMNSQTKEEDLSGAMLAGAVQREAQIGAVKAEVRKVAFPELIQRLLCALQLGKCSVSPGAAPQLLPCCPGCAWEGRAAGEQVQCFTQGVQEEE